MLLENAALSNKAYSDFSGVECSVSINIVKNVSSSSLTYTHTHTSASSESNEVYV